MRTIKHEPVRRFLGKTEGFTSKEEKVFHQRMLKSYLNGNTHFHYGFMTVGHQRQPARHLVLQEYPLRDRHPSNRKKA